MGDPGERASPGAAVCRRNCGLQGGTDEPLTASQRKDQEINSPASLSSFPLISCQRLLIGQIQSEAPGKAVCGWSPSSAGSQDRGRWVRVWRSKWKALPSTTFPAPLHPEKAMLSPFLTAAFALHSIQPLGKKRTTRGPRNALTVMALRMELGEVVRSRRGMKHPLAQKSLSWGPGPHPRELHPRKCMRLAAATHL